VVIKTKTYAIYLRNEKKIVEIELKKRCISRPHDAKVSFMKFCVNVLKKQKERLKTTITYEQKNYYYSLFAANISTHR